MSVTTSTVTPADERETVATSFSRTDRYLRRRPFLVIELRYRPAKNVRTERRGWGKNPDNWDTFESHMVVDCITPNIMTRAHVIVDVTKGVVVKSRMESGDEAVAAHFLDKYRSSVVDAMNRWINREAADLARSKLYG